MKSKVLMLALAMAASVFSVAAQVGNKVIVDKPRLMLYVTDAHNDTIFRSPVSVGVNFGDKQRSGDCRTPEGEFTICQIQNSSYWTHDFKDGKGEREGAYGPWFIRLKMPKWTSIGIHGTCFPESIGTRASEGCIRMPNEKLVEFKELVKIGTPVVVLPDPK